MGKRSDLMTKGPERAPHRSLLRADGFTDWELLDSIGWTFPVINSPIAIVIFPLTGEPGCIEASSRVTEPIIILVFALIMPRKPG